MRITLCGSLRFLDQFHAWNKVLSWAGNTVYSVHEISTDEKADVPERTKKLLDLVHLNKISNSEAILVIDCALTPDMVISGNYTVADAERYIGDSTGREIAWAEMQRKLKYFTSLDGDVLRSWMARPAGSYIK